MNTEDALVLKQLVTEEPAGRLEAAVPDQSELYRRVAMVITPWGDSSKLRDQKLPPGRATPAEAVRESQRMRLFAALVAAVEAKGYERARVADLLTLSGVSRKAFYELFSSKQDCLLEAVEALIELTIVPVLSAIDKPPGMERARDAFGAFIDSVAAQPAAARMCVVEIYAAGPRAVAVADRAMDAAAKLMEQALDQMPGRESMPPEIARAMVGGLRKIMHKRLYRHEEAELLELVPEMWNWGLTYLPPPQPLRQPRGRRPRQPRPLEEYEPSERILRALAAAVAKNGYPATKLSEIATRASISLSTFYEYFDGKEEAMRAAVDSGSAQMLAAMLPAFRRATDWPESIRLTYEAMFAWAASEPDYAQLGAVEVYAAGRRALEQRDQVMEGLEALLGTGYELAPNTSPIAAEAIGGAIYALIYDQVKSGGPASLPQIGPLATYITLAPFLGAEQACAVANRDGRGREAR
jgi:AcrR family transcriptional regulator